MAGIVDEADATLGPGAQVVVAGPAAATLRLTTEEVAPGADNDAAPVLALRSSPVSISSAATTGLLVLALLYVSSLIVPILMAIILAAMFKVMFSPLIELLRRMGIPRMVSALLVVASLPVLVGYGLMQLGQPFGEWLDEAPRTLDRVERRLMPLIDPIRDVREAADAMDDLASLPGERVDTVHLAAPDLLEQAASVFPSLVLGLTVTVFVTFFLLGSGDAFLRKLASAGQSFAERRQIVEMMRQIQTDLGNYLRTITMINVSLGVVTAGVMWALGLPNPLMWGVIAALLNYAPYVGAVMVIAGLTLTGLAASDSLTTALIPAASYLLLATIEGQMITPAVLGHRMSMSPLVVFIGVVLAGWLWGIAGALIAVPVLVTVKIVGEHIEPMRLVALLMGR